MLFIPCMCKHVLVQISRLCQWPTYRYSLPHSKHRSQAECCPLQHLLGWNQIPHSNHVKAVFLPPNIRKRNCQTNLLLLCTVIFTNISVFSNMFYILQNEIRFLSFFQLLTATNTKLPLLPATSLPDGSAVC